MSKHLQQPDARLQSNRREAGVAVRSAPLNANYSLLLLLVLIIIPTLNGVALIA